MKLAYSIITNHILATMPKITVTAGVCRWNYMCQMNTVHDALNDGHQKIAMCFYLEEMRPIIHFVNIDDTGKYIDNTFGRWCEKYDYYLVRFIEKESFFEVDDIFKAYRKELNRMLPWWIRIFGRVEF